MPYLHDVIEFQPDRKNPLRYHLFSSKEAAEIFLATKYMGHPDFPTFQYSGGRHWDTRVLVETSTVDHRK